jgi:hypothetical protein
MRGFITCRFLPYNYNGEVKEDEEGKACRKNFAKENAYRILVEKPEGKRPLGSPKRSWLTSIIIYLR